MRALAVLLITVLAAATRVDAQTMVPEFICRNMQNGMRQTWIVLRPENSTIHSFDDPGEHGTVSAQFRSNNTVYSVIHANYGMANGRTSFLFDVGNDTLDTQEGVSTILGKAEPSSMQWSCFKAQFAYSFSGR